jgi:hypothetical protein
VLLPRRRPRLSLTLGEHCKSRSCAVDHRAAFGFDSRQQHRGAEVQTIF